MDILREPRVTLIARPQFLEPGHLPVQWKGDSSDGERIAEFAGRLCYMSQNNPAGRTTAEYLRNILEQGHGSVFEHSTYVMLIEGISRSCSHELVRHRAGWGYSQLSQRYVDESHAAFVMPPDQATHARAEEVGGGADGPRRGHFPGAPLGRRQVHRWRVRRGTSPQRHRGEDRGEPNVARRTMLGSPGAGAELEIRRMAVACLRLLQREAAALFGDFEIYPAGDGSEAGRVGFHKV
jgi:thymidylate synthase (FAD)